jgi:hypothetical protein
MGREATVQCQWAEQSGLCKVLLETHDLIVRRPIGRKVPISTLRNVDVRGDELCFRVGDDVVSLNLGSTLAQKWAKAIGTPPPSLAAKLGITTKSRLLVIGDLDSSELNAAIDEAASITGKDSDLALISVENPHDLELALAQLAKRQSPLPALWIVYPKGKVKGFSETSVREILRGRGFIDTKVASVSSRLTALRFIKRGS